MRFRCGSFDRVCNFKNMRYKCLKKTFREKKKRTELNFKFKSHLERNVRKRDIQRILAPCHILTSRVQKKGREKRPPAGWKKKKDKSGGPASRGEGFFFACRRRANEREGVYHPGNRTRALEWEIIDDDLCHCYSGG